MSNERKQKAGFFLFLALLAAVTLLFASQCSPLYPFNEWTDTNCFLTVGRGMLEGKVPYRDLYEQKGPYVYFLHALCALAFPGSFFGVYLMEVVACVCMLLLADRILRLYGVIAYGTRAAILTLTTLTVCVSYSFSTGDSVEEFCCPLLLVTIVLTLSRLKAGGEFAFWEYLLIGVTSGIVFWIKFSIVAFYVAWFVFFVCHCIKNGKLRQIWRCILWVIVGVAAATLPCLFYFGSNGALADWMSVYLYDNVFLYQETNFLLRMAKMLGFFLASVGMNAQFTLLGVFGCVFLAKREKSERLFFASVPLLTGLLLFSGGRMYRYYGLPLSIFTVFGYIALVQCGGWRNRVTKALAPVLAVCSVALFLGLNGNYFHLLQKREDTVQYRFAEIVKQEEGATLLNYGSLDSGFYLFADQTPAFRYFAELNIPKTEMLEEQRRYLDEGLADFVVVKLLEDYDTELINPNYSEVARETVTYRNRPATYILYRYTGEADRFE